MRTSSRAPLVRPAALARSSRHGPLEARPAQPPSPPSSAISARAGSCHTRGMRLISRVLSALGVALLVLGTVAGVVNREVLDADRFLDHVDAVRADPHVSQAVGGLLTDRILAAHPDLTAVRPLLQSAATAVVASPSSSVAARAAVTPLHRNLTGDQRGTVVLRLADAGAVVVASARALSPRVEATLPADLDVHLSQVGGAELSHEVMWQVHLTSLLARVAPGLGLVLLFGAGWLGSAGPRRLHTGLAYVGRGAVAGGVTLALLLVIVGFLVGGPTRRCCVARSSKRYGPS